MPNGDEHCPRSNQGIAFDVDATQIDEKTVTIDEDMFGDKCVCSKVSLRRWVEYGCVV